MPLSPFRIADHASAIVLPIGQTMPRPVMTTRRLLNLARTQAFPRGSGLVAAFGDVVDGLLDGGYFFCVFVRDLDLELFLEGHDEFDRIERIGPEVVNERGGARDLFGLDAQLLGN